MYIEHSRVYLDPSGKNTYLYSCYCCFFLFLAKECRLNHLLLLRGSQIIILKPLFPTLIVQIMCPSSAIKILIIKKLFSDSSLCWLVTNKQTKKGYISTLWLTYCEWQSILISTIGSPIILELGLRVRNNVLRDLLKLFKTGWPVLLGQIVFFIMNNHDNAIPPRHSELCRTNCMCVNVTIISFCWVQNMCSSVLCT